MLCCDAGKPKEDPDGIPIRQTIGVLNTDAKREAWQIKAEEAKLAEQRKRAARYTRGEFADALVVKVYDWDAMSSPDLIGSITIPMRKVTPPP